MDAVNKLLDRAKKARSLPSDVALAGSLGVSRQLVSQWRNGANPMSDERIAQVADLAQVDAAQWLVAIHAAQTSGAAHKAWERLARQIGAAAVLAVAALFPFQSARAATLTDAPSMHYAQWARRFRSRMFRWFTAWSLSRGPSAVLA